MDVTPHIDGVVRSFADFLRHTAPIVGPLSRQVGATGYWNDWTQANWEALVEATLPRTSNVRLRVYGDGAMCHGYRSRIILPRLAETHLVACRPRGDLRPLDLLSGTIVVHPNALLVFDRFVAIDGDRVTEAPPFDCVRVNTPDDGSIVLPIDGVTFHLIERSRLGDHRRG